MSHKKNFKERNKKRFAEPKAKAYYETRRCHITRSGLDMLDTGIKPTDFLKIPSIVRNTPDYLVVSADAYLVEVKGCVGVARFKLEDLKSYRKWNDVMPVFFFVYDKGKDEFVHIKFQDFEKLIQTNKYSLEIYKNDDGSYETILDADTNEKVVKKYYPIPYNDIVPWDMTDSLTKEK